MSDARNFDFRAAPELSASGDRRNEEFAISCASVIRMMPQTQQRLANTLRDLID